MLGGGGLPGQVVPMGLLALQLGDLPLQRGDLAVGAVAPAAVQLFGDDPNAPAELVTDKVVMDITDMEFGFARTKVKDERFDFYLVPSVTLSGSYTAYNSGGEEIYTYPENGRSDVVLVLNLVDGSVINYAQ